MITVFFVLFAVKVEEQLNAYLKYTESLWILIWLAVGSPLRACGAHYLPLPHYAGLVHDDCTLSLLAICQQQPARSGQSLLAPITPAPPSPPAPTPPSPSPPPEDSKAALRALIEDALRDEPTDDVNDSNIDTHEVEVDFERLQVRRNVRNYYFS